MLPGILNQLGAESLSSLKKLASTVAGGEYLREYSSLFTLSLCVLFIIQCFYMPNCSVKEK